ncbi:MAG: hypothetical protein QM760_11570 [Nibricoccus sp.]
MKIIADAKTDKILGAQILGRRTPANSSAKSSRTWNTAAAPRTSPAPFTRTRP